MAGPRMRRINEVLREVVGGTISDLSDPRIGFVTVTAVETSPDLRTAKVHVSVLGDEEEREEDGVFRLHGVGDGARVGGAAVRGRERGSLPMHRARAVARAP